MSSKYLTKSKFQIALSCETKLFYGANKKYKNKNIDDTFMAALAEGGYQVGELAKCYYPGGFEINELDYNTALAKTNELLTHENVIIYEAALCYGNLFIRADILVKKANSIELIEVKAKSFKGDDSIDFLNKKGFLNTAWSSYLYDVAFQKYVVMNAFPNWNVKAFLMLADKKKQATVDGLNQKFFVEKDANGRLGVKIQGSVERAELGDEILVKVSVDDILVKIYQGIESKEPPEKSFNDRVHFLENQYIENKKIVTPIGVKCKACEFKCSLEEEESGLISGFKECWKDQLNWPDTYFEIPHIFEIWNFRKKDQLMEAGKHFINKLDENDIGIKESEKDGLTTSERQWIQIKKVKNNDNSAFIDKDGLKEEMNNWKFPLHFIDFETSALALPFYKGLQPYEGVAFQFSHHIAFEDGSYEHKGQYLNIEQGHFPNFDFVRALKSELENDEGSVFRYAAHENTYMNIIFNQLKRSDEPDKQELCDWIQTISHSGGDTADQWKGDRDMIDLLDVVKNYYYHPLMKGSNSIKVVLPAILNDSQFLQTKYSQPIYGNEINSLNYKKWTWVQLDENNKVKDPYKLLPPVFEGVNNELLDTFITDENIADGGAAMMAYARMQFTEMTDIEKKMIAKALFKYCELDTWAMVVIWEKFINVINR
jgi:hypothetical protein